MLIVVVMVMVPLATEIAFHDQLERGYWQESTIFKLVVMILVLFGI
jgi:hypothetical protein